MPDFQDNNRSYKRRSSDTLAGGHQPTIVDVWKLLNEINDRLDDLERNFDTITTAFPIDDLSKPDYAGHRRQHVELRKGQEIMDGYKTDATKQIIKMIVIFIAGLITTGLVTKLTMLVQ